jgi:XRE family transcriptional regulator of biofilm formation
MIINIMVRRPGMVEPIPRLGKRIQGLREKCGLSVQELADRAGTTYQSIWRIERGDQKDPSVALMRGIARTLGVGVDYLISMFGKDEIDSELVGPMSL